MFKVVHNLVPYLSEQFSRRNTAHDHNTRGNHVNLSIPKPNTNILKNSLAYNGADTLSEASLPNTGQETHEEFQEINLVLSVSDG